MATGSAAAQNITAEEPDAPQKITVTYKSEADALTPFERGLAEFNGMNYYEVHTGAKRTLTGLTEVVCRNGEMIENELLPIGFSITEVSTMCFYVQSLSDDSVKLLIRTDGGMGMPPRILPLDQKHRHILMETFDGVAGEVETDDSGVGVSVEYPLETIVPLIAYTTGLVVDLKLDGFTGTLLDYCALRDKHVHPSRWYAEFGVDNYIYYIAKFK